MTIALNVSHLLAAIWIVIIVICAAWVVNQASGDWDFFTGPALVFLFLLLVLGLVVIGGIWWW